MGVLSAAPPPFTPLQVPEAPPCDEDFVLVRRRGAGSAEVDGRHAELMERLRRQHEVLGGGGVLEGCKVMGGLGWVEGVLEGSWKGIK